MEQKLENFILFRQTLIVLIIASGIVIISQILYHLNNVVEKMPLWFNALCLIISGATLLLTIIYLTQIKNEERKVINAIKKLPDKRKIVLAVEDIDFLDGERHLDDPYKMIEGLYTGRLNGTYKLEGNITKRLRFEKIISPNIKEDYIVYKDIPEKFLKNTLLRTILPPAKHFTNK
jgi:hypothetical protein